MLVCEHSQIVKGGMKLSIVQRSKSVIFFSHHFRSWEKPNLSVEVHLPQTNLNYHLHQKHNNTIISNLYFLLINVNFFFPSKESIHVDQFFFFKNEYC